MDKFNIGNIVKCKNYQIDVSRFDNMKLCETGDVGWIIDSVDLTERGGSVQYRVDFNGFDNPKIFGTGKHWIDIRDFKRVSEEKMDNVYVKVLRYHHDSLWYNDKIGHVFKCVRDDINGFAVLDDFNQKIGYFINSNDCREIIISQKNIEEISKRKDLQTKQLLNMLW